MIKRVEINYRGIFQKTLARRVGSDLVLVARRLDKVGFSNGRYSDAPERNGVPSKYFAFISPDLGEEELEAECGGKLDIDEADVSVLLDDTILRGVEPWAWHGIRPPNEKIGEGGCAVVVSRREPAEIRAELPTKPFPYRLAVLAGDASFSGMWVFRDDMTHERVLGAIAAVDPAIVTIEAVQDLLRTRADGTARAEAARAAYDSVLGAVQSIGPGEGRQWPHKIPDLPAWQAFREASTVPAVVQRPHVMAGGPARNQQFRRGTSKTERPLVRFDICTKCTLCWLECPDGAFDPTDDGLYDVHYSYCSGCGKCAEVCPVTNCIVMVNELHFDDEESPWAAYRNDPVGYGAWVDAKAASPAPIRAHITARPLEVVGSSSSPQRRGGSKR